MQTVSWFCFVCAFCYFALLGIEYSKYVRGQNWTPTTAVVDKAINSIPATKFEPNRANEIATIVNWSYIKYEYKVGEGIYQHTEELGPHLALFDFWIGPMAYRFRHGDTIQIKYNEHDPNQSVFGFDVFRPVETLGGTAMVFILVALIMIFLQNLSKSTESTDTENIPY